MVAQQARLKGNIAHSVPGLPSGVLWFSQIVPRVGRRRSDVREQIIINRFEMMNMTVMRVLRRWRRPVGARSRESVEIIMRFGHW